MVTTRPRAEIVLLAVAVLLLGAWSWLRATGARSLTSLGLGGAEPRVAESPLPRIALDRLGHEPPEDKGAAGRDPFRFGQPPPPAQPELVPVPVTPPAQADTGPASPPPPPTLPPFPVKFIGSIEQKGLRVAILLSDDKKEVLTGREGDTVANRLKIVKIGFESVDVQDIGSERVRRIPLKGN